MHALILTLVRPEGKNRGQLRQATQLFNSLAIVILNGVIIDVENSVRVFSSLGKYPVRIYRIIYTFQDYALIV